MKTILLATVFGAACIGSAFGADLGGSSLKDSGYSTERPFSFTGFYVGAHVGYAVGDADFSTDYSYQDGEYSGGSNLIGIQGLSLSGARAGVDAEYLYDAGRFVFGVGGFYDWAGQEWKGSIGDGLLHAEAEIDSGWGVYGKFGPKLGKETLAYVLLGYGQDNLSVKAGIGPDNQFSKDVDASGILVGLGIQHHLGDGWHVKAEALGLFADDEELFKSGRKYENGDEDSIAGKIGLDNFQARIGVARQF